MNFEGLRPELQEKVKDCHAREELLALAMDEGVELSDEDLEQVSGGWGSDSGSDSGVTCPNCGSANVEGQSVRAGEGYYEEYTCRDCGANWSKQY